MQHLPVHVVGQRGRQIHDRACRLLRRTSTALRDRLLEHLADFLREHLKLTGTHVGCEHGVCGACTVRVNGEIVRSCLMLAVQSHGTSVETIEGLSDSGEIADLQAAFRDRNALQCGFCTPGMLVAAQELLKQETEPDRERIRKHLSGNYCRCTGYQAIIDAVETTGRLRMGRKP